MTSLSAASGPPPAQTSTDIVWLVKQFAEQNPGIVHVLLVSADGLQLAVSDGVGRDLADQLAAVTSGQVNLADSAGDLLGLGSSQGLTIRYLDGHVLIMRVGDSAGLTVLAAVSTDLRVLAFQMAQFVGSIGHVLTPQTRADLHRRTLAATTR